MNTIKKVTRKIIASTETIYNNNRPKLIPGFIFLRKKRELKKAAASAATMMSRMMTVFKSLNLLFLKMASL